MRVTFIKLEAFESFHMPGGMKMHSKSYRVQHCPPWVSGSAADSCTPARWSSPSLGRCCRSSGLWQGSHRDPRREPTTVGSREFKQALVYWYHQLYKDQINNQSDWESPITSQLIRCKSWLHGKSANKIRVRLFVFRDLMNCFPLSGFLQRIMAVQSLRSSVTLMNEIKNSLLANEMVLGEQWWTHEHGLRFLESLLQRDPFCINKLSL